ncbi:hypothetical protein DYB32_007621 [Aphanomyces invadans]|uniref:Uncharacterized protein n=1 Tax=Aphanomyces invadans TaxID=157072 RepID=A0A418AN09_9STRA|nr:hypothetical protein DYB32_007621 [Aphanomyces invadans]
MSYSPPRVPRRRGICIVPDCGNQVYARKLCCRHGAKKQCAFEGCTLRARLNDVCYNHGAAKKECAEYGCTQPAQARHRCVKHGGGRHCNANGCTSHSRIGGYCQRHRYAPTQMEHGEYGMPYTWGDDYQSSLGNPSYHHFRSYSIDSMDDVSYVDPPLATIDPSLQCIIDNICFAPSRWHPLRGDDAAMMQEVFGLLKSL